MTTTTTGAQLLVEALVRAGSERLFTLSGNQVLPIYDALVGSGIAVTDTRHEAAAAHMAEAWARLRDQPGVCLVSAGPGHTNTLTAIGNALHNEVPVLWLSGGAELSLSGQGGFQEMDQAGLAAPLCKAAWTIERVEEIPAQLARAWRLMLSGRPGPVHLTLPFDLQTQAPASPPAPVAAADHQPPPALADPTAVEQAVAALAQAKRPLALVSPSAARGRARQHLQHLQQRLGLPWFAVESPRGLNDPAWHGAGQLFREADVVLLLASQDYAVGFAGPRALAADCTLIQLAPGAAELGRHRVPRIGLVGDVATVLGQLAAASGPHDRPAGDWARRLAEHQAAARDRLAAAAQSTAAPLHPLRLMAELRALLPAGAVVVQDGGEFGQWARWGLGDAPVETLVNGKFGMIGSAIPLAMGAALARPTTPAVALLGDGTFGFHALEFDTAVRHGIPFVAIIGNDAAWAAERHRQLRLYGQDRIVASDLLPARYDLVATALGAVGELVEHPDQLRPALERALGSGRPACVNVMIESIPSPAAY